MGNGVKLDWLVNPKTEEVYIYRQLVEIDLVEGFKNVLSGENILPNFTFDLSIIR